MLPLVRLNRLAFRAASLASTRLDQVNNSSAITSIFNNKNYNDERQHAENIDIIKNIEKLEITFQEDEKRNGSSRNLAEIFDKLRTLKQDNKNNQNQQHQMLLHLRLQETEQGENNQNALESETLDRQQESIFLAAFINSMILQLYNVGVSDRTLWLQLKSLALRVNSFSSSLAVVTNLECLARKSVCGPLECKSFQLQLSSTDLAALPAVEVLRLVAACQLCGAPLQQNVKNLIISRGLSWIESAAGGTANCSMWWVLADAVDQLPSHVRKSLAFNLIFAIEKIRSSSVVITSTKMSENNNNADSHQYYDDSKLRQLWPQHDKDTTFIMWRLRTNSNLSLTKGSEVPAESNPPFSDALLTSIRVDKLPTARSCLLLLRALCLGTEDLSPTALIIAEDSCRILYNNVIENRIPSRFVHRTIIHSIAGSEQVRTKVPTAAILGVETSLQYLRHHSHFITNETTCCIMKLVIVAVENCSKQGHSLPNVNNNNNTPATVTSVIIDQVKTKLEQTMRRLILISSSSSNLSELLSLASQVGILDLSSAEFALDLLQTQKANPHEIGKIASIVEKLRKDKKKLLGDTKIHNSNSEQEKTIKENITSPKSLISNWSEIRSLPSPRIAFYAANAAKQMFENANNNTSSTIMSSVVAPISNIISSSSSPSSPNSNQHSPKNNINSNNNNSESGSFILGTSLFSLSSAQSEIVAHHKGLRALSAGDCATLVGATTVLPSEAKSLVLRIPENDFFDSSINNKNINKFAVTSPRIPLRSKKSKINQNEKTNSSEPVGQDNVKEAKSSVSSCVNDQNPLLKELQSCVAFLEAQGSINTCLEINSGADFAIFTSAQRRLTKFFQLASYPPPFEYSDDAVWVSWCGRLVSAMAFHRLATVRLPLWLMNVFIEKYCFSLNNSEGTPSSTTTTTTKANTAENVFRSIRALHACCYFGFADTTKLKIVQEGIMRAFSDKQNSSMVLSPHLSPKALLQILRSLPHVISSKKYMKEFDDVQAKPQVEAWLQEFSTKMNEMKEREKQELVSSKEVKNSNTVDQETKSTVKKAENSNNGIDSSKQKSVSALQNPNLYKGGFGSSLATSENISSYFNITERRKLFDVLCCAAHLDLPPNQYKHLIEHLHPFDTSIYPLADSMFFFGHAAQKKRLSGFSLRVWRTLTMQLDKVTMINGNGGSFSDSSSSSSSSPLLSSLTSSGISETLTSNNNNLLFLSSSSSSSSNPQQQQSLVHHGSSSSGTSCGLPLVQTSMLVPPILLSLAYYISFGGGSSTIDSLIDKLRRFAPFEPLLLAKVARIAMAPSGLKTRPVLSQFICRSFDSTTARSLSSNDLVMIMEVFSSNQAQRVSVGLIQADAMVTLAWESLFVRLDSIPDDLFVRAAAVPCPNSLHQSGGVVTKIIKRLLKIAKKDVEDHNATSGKKEDETNNSSRNFVPVVVRERHIWTPIIFQHVVSHVANVREYHANCSSNNINNSNNNKEVASSSYDYYSKRNADGSLVKLQDEECKFSTFFDDEHELENAAELWEEIKDFLLEPLQSHLKGADKEAMEELLSM